MGTKVVLKKVRASFVQDLFNASVPPNSAPGSTPKHRMQAIFEIDGEAHKACEAALEHEASAKWPGVDAKKQPKWKAIVAQIPRDKMFLKEGNLNLTKVGDIYDGYADMMYIVATNPVRPYIVDNKKDPETGRARKVSGDEGRIYSGCYVNVEIDVYAREKQGQGRGIHATLLGVQFAGDGDAFGGGGVSNGEAFDSLAVEDEDASLLGE